MIGKTLGHYRVGEQLGRGGMGEVYLADDLNLNRKVALKFLPEAFAADPERMARFEREAKLLASLNHPNIAAIYGLEQAEGKRFLVLELVEGETLAQRLSKGALAVDEALGVCRQIADALEAAHEKGVIHRDLKPANVMITEGDKVKILDFGLAKALSDETQSVDSSQSSTLTEAMTRPGVILGTAAYMSPEQAKGKAVDKRADIWAFGCILYECLTGKRAFEGETVTETLAAVLTRGPDWNALPATIPPSIGFVLRRCLEKQMSRRLRDAADVAIVIDEEFAAPADAHSTNADRERPIWRRIAAFGGVALLVAVVASIVTWYLKPSQTNPAPAHVAIPLPPGDRVESQGWNPLALSPDGKQLVYVAIHNGIQQLFLRSLDNLESKPIPGTAGAASPFFSPDGQRIGFFAQGKIMKVSIAGGAPQLLCASGNNGGASWGIDDTIVYTPGAGSALWRVPASGGTPKELTKLDRSQGEVSHRWPQFLPGGRALLFTVWAGEGWDETHIAVLRLDTGEQRIVLRGGHSGRYAPTGHLVYYRAGALLAVPFDPIQLKVISEAPMTIVDGIAQSSLTTGAEYAFSYSGSLAYISASPRQFEKRLVWVDRKGEVKALPAPTRPYSNIALSSDGLQLALIIDSGKRELCVYNLARGTLSPLTSEAGSNMDPLWTPDGKRIAYRATRKGLRNVFWRAFDGTGEEERLTTGEGIQSPYSWSPDGKVLAYTNIDPTTGDVDIWVLRFEEERKPEAFLRNPFTEYQPAFSPDGRWLAYASRESGRLEIWVRPFPKRTGKWQISTEGGSEPRWARNGREFELFYRIGNKMMVVDISTQPTFTPSVPRQLFEGSYLSVPAAAYDLSTDGQRFFMIQSVDAERPATQINLILNWFEELKRRTGNQP
jgi:serine/threonine protein kinase